MPLTRTGQPRRWLVWGGHGSSLDLLWLRVAGCLLPALPLHKHTLLPLTFLLMNSSSPGCCFWPQADSGVFLLQHMIQTLLSGCFLQVMDTCNWPRVPGWVRVDDAGSQSQRHPADLLWCFLALCGA